jgi:hypothetical protein
MKFQHYIITRFNLPVFAKKVNKAVTAPASSDEYLSKRFPIFENYCFPSIKNQTCQDFKWLVLFDSHTPDKFKDWANRLHEEYDNFVPCYLDVHQYEQLPEDYLALFKADEENLYKADVGHVELDEMILHHVITPAFIREQIRQFSDEIPDYYITTRIDNDDAFHKDMVKTVQERFLSNPQRVLYDFPYLYKYVLEQGVVYKFELKNGHFSTLVELGSTTPQFVTYWNHLFVEMFVNTEHIYTKPMGVELVHGQNVCNDFTDSSIAGIVYAMSFFRKSDFGYKNSRYSFIQNLRVIAFYIKQKLIKALYGK